VKYIYVTGYMDLTRDEKVKLFIFLKNFTECMITRRRTVQGKDGLLLDFPEDTDMQKIKKLIDRYFKSKENIFVKIVKNVIYKDDHQILELEDENIRI
jgi:UDP-galactopyranose mutase